MKKLFSILAVMTIFVLSATAQSGFKKSDKILEGMVSYTKASGDVEWSIAPSFGYFITDKVAVGIKAELGEKDGTNTSTNNLGVFARCYFLTVGKNLKIYSQLDIGSNSTKVSSARTNTFVTNVGVGANYFITSKLALSAHLCDLASYSSTKGDSKFSVGFNGVDNPMSMASFGLLIKL